MNGYNGWNNYETWNVPLWIDNDEGLYRERMNWMRGMAGIDGSDVENFVKGLFPNGTPDMDGPGDLDKVDWDEIAEAWSGERDDE